MQGLSTSMQTKACHGDLCFMFTIFIYISNQQLHHHHLHHHHHHHHDHDHHHHAISCLSGIWLPTISIRFTTFDLTVTGLVLSRAQNSWLPPSGTPLGVSTYSNSSAENYSHKSDTVHFHDKKTHYRAIWPIESLPCSVRCLGIHRWITQITTFGRNLSEVRVDATKWKLRGVPHSHGSQGKRKEPWFNNYNNCHGGWAITSPETKKLQRFGWGWMRHLRNLYRLYIFWSNLINHGHATHRVAPYIAKSQTMEMNSLSWNPASLELIPLLSTSRTPSEDTRMPRTRRNKRHNKNNYDNNRKNNNAYNIQQHW